MVDHECPPAKSETTNFANGKPEDPRVVRNTPKENLFSPKEKKFSPKEKKIMNAKI